MEAQAHAPVTTGKAFKKMELKLLENVREHLGGETPEVIFRGQTFISPIVYLLIGPIVFIFMVKPRTIVVTGSRIHTFQQSLWRPSKVTAVVSQHDRGAVDAELTRFSITLGDDDKLYALWGTADAMKAAAAAVQQGAPAAAQQGAAPAA